MKPEGTPIFYKKTGVVPLPPHIFLLDSFQFRLDLLLTNPLAAEHETFDIFELAEIFQRVSGYQDKVRCSTRLDYAILTLLPKITGNIGGA